MKYVLAFLALGVVLFSYNNCANPVATGTTSSQRSRSDNDDSNTDVVACTASIAQVVDQTSGLYRHDLTVDKNDVFYSVVAQGNSLIVRYSSNRGATWQSMAAPPLISSNIGRTNIFAARSGNIYLATSGATAAGDARLFVWKATGPQSQWSVIENVAQSGGSYRDLYVDEQENIFVAGIRGGWFVRKSVNGQAFTQVDSMGPAATSQGTPFAAAITGDPTSGTIYVGGSANTGLSGNETWTIRQSINKGASWQTIDSFLSATPSWAHVYGLTFSAGALYATGQAGENLGGINYLNRWFTRKGPTGFVTVDRLPAATGTNQVFTGRKITADAKGNLFMAGFQGPNNTTASNFIVNMSTTNGTSWSTVFSIPFTGNIEDFSSELAIDRSGTLLISRSDRIWSMCP